MGLGELHSKQSKPRDVASDLAVLDGLLSTLTDVLDIREVFEHSGPHCRCAWRKDSRKAAKLIEIKQEVDGGSRSV